jgi:hypothetical protein
MDIAYGDSPAAMVFDTLWDSEKGLPATEAEVTDAKKKEAVELLKLKNGYLRRNVLMFALDKAAHVDAQRRPLGVESYRFALEFMQKTAEEHAPEAQLVFDFDGKIKFTNVWVPKDGTADCSKDTAQCYRVPHAVIAGVAIPLPSSDDFALRKLTYPRTLLDLMQAREQVVDSLADYAVLDSAVVALPAKDRAKAKRGFVEALVSLQK